MTRTFFFILFLFLSLWNLSGCRASKELKARNERTSTEETGVELRKADSLWSSIVERFNCKIEFYPIEYGSEKPATDSTCPAAPSTTMPANSQFPPKGVSAGIGGMGAAIRQAQGAVKSIEFTIEHNAQTTATNQVDSTYYNKSSTEETLQEEKASELRQDNGTWAILAVVTAVVFILIVLIVIRKFFKK